MIRVTRQRADQLSRSPGFPHPQATLSAGRVWNRESVIVWAISLGRLAAHPGPDLLAQVESRVTGGQVVVIESKAFLVRQVIGSEEPEVGSDRFPYRYEVKGPLRSHSVAKQRQYRWLADGNGQFLDEPDGAAPQLRSQAEQALATWIDLYG
jgi:hypothetical protein